MSSICHTLSEVLDNRKVAGDVYLVSVRAPRIVKQAQPGQFVHLRVGNSDHPLLRRPFSVHWVEGEKFEILYQVVGIGTRLFSRVRSGETLDLIGPLGRGFDLSGAGSALIVAGGLGIAPLAFLAQRLRGKSLTVLIGGATKELILCEERMRRLAAEVRVITEDGSSGAKGLVTDLLTSYLTQAGAVFACGPRQMLKAVKDACRERSGLSTQVCLEDRMGCGVGACLGCAVRSSKGRYKRVCSDGPVFRASEVIL